MLHLLQKQWARKRYSTVHFSISVFRGIDQNLKVKHFTSLHEYCWLSWSLKAGYEVKLRPVNTPCAINAVGAAHTAPTIVSFFSHACMVKAHTYVLTHFSILKLLTWIPLSRQVFYDKLRDLSTPPNLQPKENGLAVTTPFRRPVATSWHFHHLQKLWHRVLHLK